MRVVTSEVNEIRMQILDEISCSNRTAISLIRQGYATSSVHRSLTALINQKLIYRHGENKSAYYSISPYESEGMIDPIVVPEVYASDFSLAFRMGYTAIVPKKGRVHKEDKS